MIRLVFEVKRSSPRKGGSRAAETTNREVGENSCRPKPSKEITRRAIRPRVTSFRRAADVTVTDKPASRCYESRLRCPAGSFGARTNFRVSILDINYSCLTILEIMEI